MRWPVSTRSDRMSVFPQDWSPGSDTPLHPMQPAGYQRMSGSGESGGNTGAEGATAPVNSQAQRTVLPKDSEEWCSRTRRRDNDLRRSGWSKDRGGIGGQGFACLIGAGPRVRRWGQEWTRIPQYYKDLRCMTCICRWVGGWCPLRATTCRCNTRRG